MFRLFSGIKKEFLLLIRDLPGLGVLFLMPVLLIMIVSLAQKNALKSSKESKTEILFLDLSNSNLSKQIRKNLEESALFQLITKINGSEINEQKLVRSVSKGDFQAGVIIDEKDSAIRIVTDPSLQPAYKNSVSGSITFLVKSTQSRVAIENLLKTMAPGKEQILNNMITNSINNLAPVRETYAETGTRIIRPTLTQNLIPGFILFAMFFIVMPLSGSLLAEKNEGTFLRLKAMPVSTLNVLSAKVIIYLVVCLIQFLLMILVGTWLLPVFFDIPALQLGHHYFAIIVATLAAALAAVGFGLLIGSLSTTHAQASISGSMSVVILGVISGTFLPVYLMPQFLQGLSMASPIRWGIDNYLTIFIREAGFPDLYPKLMLLILFFAMSLGFSILLFAKKR